MKVTDRDPDFWKPADGNETWAQAIAAFAAFVIVLIALYVWTITLAVAQ